jgi:dihydrofolate reductase
MTELSLIVAMDENRLIGSNNNLPWQLPADLAFFKRTTMGKPIIMGRKTFISIGRPLPGRRNIVITRDTGFSAEGCEIANGIETALALCSDAEEVMLIGGASLYQQTIDQATQLYITHIHHSFAGDTWFPEIDLKVWKQVCREDHDADHGNPFAYTFIKFMREF